MQRSSQSRICRALGIIAGIAMAWGMAWGQNAQPTATPPSAASPGMSVEGVFFEHEINLAGSALKLNGAGIRSKFFIKVYAAGLYLPSPAPTPADIYKGKGPRRLKVSFLRETDASSLGKSMSQTMSDNLPRDQLSKCIPGLVKLGELFAEKKKMAVGESFTIDEIPGSGTLVGINGKLALEISEGEFFKCLMYNYFGDQPADTKLKAALLGGS